MVNITDFGETQNVLIATMIISAIILIFSLTTLYVLTHDPYLDAYYTIETFFDNPNTSSSFSLAAIAFQYGIFRFCAIVGVVIIDNVSKILVISFVIAAVLNIISSANLEDVINKFKAKGIKNQVIICGYNELAGNLVQKLVKKKKNPIIVIDEDQGTAIELSKEKILAITGKFTESESLEDAGIMNASAIIFTSESDLDNVIGVVTAKKLNKNLTIMSRVSNDEVRTKMYRLGVDMCVLPEYLAGIEISDCLLDSLKGAKYAV